MSLGVVIGAGNILRGVAVSGAGLPRATADAMGMLATVVNALVLEAAIERAGVSCRTMSALAMPQVCETYERQRALRHLADGRIVLFAGGTGNPFFTTDTTAVLRAAEMGCDAVLKATNVDGVYSADPKKDPNARRFDRITHQEAIERDLKVMDATAFALARENLYAYHRFLDRRAGCDRGGAAWERARDPRGRMRSGTSRARGADRTGLYRSQTNIATRPAVLERQPWQLQPTISPN